MASQSDPVLDMAALVACDVETLGTAEAVAVLSRMRRVRGFIDSLESRVTNHVDDLYRKGRSVPANDVLARNQHVSAAEARRRERRAKALANAQSFSDALAAGDVAAEHADALANATSKLDEAMTAEFFSHEATLLGHAVATTPEQFARHCRALVHQLEHDSGLARDEQQRRETRLTRKITPDGMHHLTGVFHPELGARIFTALDHEVAALVASGGDRSVDRTQLAATALGNLVSGGHQATRPSEAEIVVLIDESTLVDDIHEHSVCETSSGAPLPPETVRRLCCQGRIVPIIFVDGVPLNVGRDQRLANRSQRRALRAMYRTCAFSGCDVAFDRCEIHHVVPWEIGGRSDLENLLPLCSRHHHLVHELGWRLHLATDRQLTITLPDGTVHSSEPIQIRTRDATRRREREICARTRERVDELVRRCHTG